LRGNEFCSVNYEIIPKVVEVNPLGGGEMPPLWPRRSTTAACPADSTGDRRAAELLVMLSACGEIGVGAVALAYPPREPAEQPGERVATPSGAARDVTIERRQS